MNARFQISLLMVMCVYTYLQSQEVQVPMDQSGSIMEITLELNKELNLYTKVIGFQGANLFQSNDTSFLLEITWQQNEKNLRRREQLSITQASELRKKK